MSSHPMTVRPSLPADHCNRRARHRRGRWWIALALGVLISALTTSELASASLPAVRNLPAQPGAVVFGSASAAEPYAHPGGLVVAGRDNYQGQAFKDVSAAGGHVLVYLDAVIDNEHGRYHDLLMNQSECGPPTRLWPGSPKANGYGHVNDFRVGSVLQQKLECVLEKMVAENPHMAGFFADDLGSRSWFPGFRWDTWGKTNQQAYRAGAIELTKTFRRVADRHGLILLVNGTWGAGSLSSNGGGYPDMGKSGNALADGGFVEHHDGQLEYFGPYGCSSQWAAQSPVTRGRAVNFAVTLSSAARSAYARSGCYAYVNQQADYGSSSVWGPFHTTGLPTGVTP